MMAVFFSWLLQLLLSKQILAWLGFYICLFLGPVQSIFDGPFSSNVNAQLFWLPSSSHFKTIGLVFLQKMIFSWFDLFSHRYSKGLHLNGFDEFC